MRMQRRVATLIVLFLLLFMQQAEHSHALTHVGEWLRASHERALAIPDSESQCGICALFAGGSAAAIDGATSTPQPFVGFAIPPLGLVSQPVSAPSYYATRAPPVVL